MMSSLPEHMDAYYLRRIMKRLTDKEMESPEQRKKDHRKNLAALEKAFEDLEKTVTEFRPPSTEPQVPANQSVKRRMPHEIRQNLEKVAILMYTCYGGIPKDIINRLMKILGHLMHRTTLRAVVLWDPHFSSGCCQVFLQKHPSYLILLNLDYGESLFDDLRDCKNS